MAFRHDRINEQVMRVAGETVRDIKDHRVRNALVSITGAQVSADLSFAKIYFSALPAGRSETLDVTEVTKGLNSAAGFVRGRIAQELNLRITPKPTFVYDETAESAFRITEKLREISADEKTDA